MLNREILFRGKRLDNGEWVEGDLRHGGYYLNDPDVYILVPFFDTVINYPVDPETVGQYTGTTDISGQRVFEGDIMETAVSGITQHIGVVEFADEAFGLRCTDRAALFLCFTIGSHVVIGNIHDNPELLEG